MSNSITFVTKTTIPHPWLNDVNIVVYTCLADANGNPPVSAAQVIANLGIQQIASQAASVAQSNAEAYALQLVENAQFENINIQGGVAGAIPYQTAPSTTSFILPSTNGYILGFINNQPTWIPGVAFQPGTPTNVVATAGNGAAIVQFTPSSTIGGAGPPLVTVGYTVISSPAGGVDQNAGTSLGGHFITGLTNGVAYTFTVVASNSLGFTGAASAASNSVTPASSASTFNSSSTVWSASNYGVTLPFTYTPSGDPRNNLTERYNFLNQGNYVVQFDDWGPLPVVITEWINSVTDWGVMACNQQEIGTIACYPAVFRGWSTNPAILNGLSTSGVPNNPNWTTVSGMGIQCTALTNCQVHWNISTPTTATPTQYYSRWDALIDIYFHTVSNPPASAFYPQVDLQIFQMLMDDGYYTTVFEESNYFIKTIGGIEYIGVIDLNDYNQSGGHTILLTPSPNPVLTPSPNNFLWGQNVLTHDVIGIIQWLNSSPPLDNSNNPVKNVSGTAFSGPVISPSLYLTAINAGFEIDYGLTPTDCNWSTNNFWVQMQGESPGPTP